jgi:hypothetical protein
VGQNLIHQEALDCALYADFGPDIEDELDAMLGLGVPAVQS